MGKIQKLNTTQGLDGPIKGLIEMTWGLTQMGPRNHVFDGGRDRPTGTGSES